MVLPESAIEKCQTELQFIIPSRKLTYHERRTDGDGSLSAAQKRYLRVPVTSEQAAIAYRWAALAYAKSRENILYLAQAKPLKPALHKAVSKVRTNDIVFGIGPRAGTGKTYLCHCNGMDEP